MQGIWLTDFAEWLGAEGTATKPDKIIVNPEWLHRQENTPRGPFGRRPNSPRRSLGSQRPHQIALWASAERARAEIEAFEPEGFVPGAERVRKYAGKK